jgi:hypothetical protein
MLSVVFPYCTMNVVMLSAIVLDVVMLNAIILTVVAPSIQSASAVFLKLMKHTSLLRAGQLYYEKTAIVVFFVLSDLFFPESLKLENLKFNGTF